MCGGSAFRPVPSPSVFVLFFYVVSSFPSRILLSSVNDDDDQETVDGGNQKFDTPRWDDARPVRKTQVRCVHRMGMRQRHLACRHSTTSRTKNESITPGPWWHFFCRRPFLPINGNVGLVPRRVDWTRFRLSHGGAGMSKAIITRPQLGQWALINEPVVDNGTRENDNGLNWPVMRRVRYKSRLNYLNQVKDRGPSFFPPVCF